jgi:hypothetical protein
MLEIDVAGISATQTARKNAKKSSMMHVDIVRFDFFGVCCGGQLTHFT